MPEDAEYIDIVARGVEELNRRHGEGHFFLFHRDRMWSESEQRWIGWERKRGKQATQSISYRRTRARAGRISSCGRSCAARGHSFYHHSGRRHPTAARHRPEDD